MMIIVAVVVFAAFFAIGVLIGISLHREHQDRRRTRRKAAMESGRRRAGLDDRPYEGTR